MFEDALFATNHRRTPQQRWAAVMSCAAQAAFVTVIVALPLFFTDALPLDYMRSFVEMPTAPHAAAPPPTEPTPNIRHQQAASEMMDGRVIFHEVPKGPVKPIVDDFGPPQPYLGPSVPGGTGTGSGNSVINDILTGGSGKRAIVDAPPPTKPVRVSTMDEGLLIRKVTPVYPQIAIMARQQGTVLMHAIIARDGTIQQLQAISGPPLLIRAAMEAVSQWRYRPYILNGQPVEVDTQITVNFKLGG
jgi:periplasmic protein TonB